MSGLNDMLSCVRLCCQCISIFTHVFAHMSEMVAFCWFVSTDMALIEFHTFKNSASKDLKLTQWFVYLSGFPICILSWGSQFWSVWLVYLVIHNRGIVSICLISLVCSIVDSSCNSNICSCYQMCSLLSRPRSHVKNCISEVWLEIRHFQLTCST